MQTNHGRAMAAREALIAFRKAMGLENHVADAVVMRHLIAALVHWSDKRDFEWDHEVIRAIALYRANNAAEEVSFELPSSDADPYPLVMPDEDVDAVLASVDAGIDSVTGAESGSAPHGEPMWVLLKRGVGPGGLLAPCAIRLFATLPLLTRAVEQASPEIAGRLRRTLALEPGAPVLMPLVDTLDDPTKVAEVAEVQRVRIESTAP